jgi:O-6-methylguanine DNA methyltransferase
LVIESLGTESPSRLVASSFSNQPSPINDESLIKDRKSSMKAFRQRVLSAVRRIPAGRVATYGDIAALAGSPRAWRAVGTIMRECRDPGTPCHRVIASGGGLGGYGGNLQLKRELLRAEGLEVGMTRVRGFMTVRWQGRDASRPSAGFSSKIRGEKSPRTV